ncbi:MAG: benzoate-CoA ligase family protein [Myxococcota bacterium]|nr:benzoate-CoA ligase family protein [Myxococcota bacterium]
MNREAFNLADYYLFDRISEGMAERIALQFGERSWRYGEVANLAARMVAVLAQRGLRPEERVYIVLPDLPPFAWTFFGALKSGATVALGNPLSKAEDLAYVIDYIRPTVLVTTPSVIKRLEEHWQETPNTHQPVSLLVPDAATFDDPEARLPDPRCLATALNSAAPREPQHETTFDSPAIWLFTSGSTGQPKAAMHCHRDFAFNTEVYAKQTIGYRAEDICVSVPRLFFGYATGTNLMFPFAVGACAALFTEKPTAERIAWAVQYYGATALTNVPTLMAKLLEADQASPIDFSTLRFSLSAGEALPPALLERWQARFDVPVYDGIGSAEMFHIYLTNRPGDIKPGALGRPVDGYELRILPADAEGAGADEVPVGDTGVLWIKGDSVASGYWLDRAQSWHTFHGHWCRSGDLFRRDEEGYYWFCGRADHLLKVSGQWVSPLEIEQALTAHASVIEAAVIGVEVNGLMSTRAFVVSRVTPSPELATDLQAWVKTTLAKYKYPRDIVFVDDLPRNDRGKIDKKALPHD